MSATLEQVSALHRYFLWADRMRTHALDVEAVAWYQLPYRSYWYAGVYIVIEGWTELGLADGKIDELLSSPYVTALRKYRNGVFHFQPRYFDERFLEFTGATESAAWISDVHAAFYSWFTDYIGKLEEEPTNG